MYSVNSRHILTTLVYAMIIADYINLIRELYVYIRAFCIRNRLTRVNCLIRLMKST